MAFWHLTRWKTQSSPYKAWENSIELNFFPRSSSMSGRRIEEKQWCESLFVASEWPEAQLVAFRNTQKSLHFCFPSAIAPQRPAVLWCSHMLLHVLAQLHWWGISYNFCCHKWRQRSGNHFSIVSSKSQVSAPNTSMKWNLNVLEACWNVVPESSIQRYTAYLYGLSSRPCLFSDNSHCHCHSPHCYNHCLSRCHRTLPHIASYCLSPFSPSITLNIFLALNACLCFACLEKKKTIIGWTIFVTAESNLILCWSRACCGQHAVVRAHFATFPLSLTPWSLPGHFLSAWGSRQRKVSRDAKSARKIKQKPDETSCANVKKNIV